MSTVFQPPMTWIDVARELASLPSGELNVPETVIRARVSWSGLIIEVFEEEDESKIYNWLNGIFPGRVDQSLKSLRLEGPDMDTDLPIEVEVVENTFCARHSLGVIDGVIDFAGGTKKFAGMENRQDGSQVAVVSRPVPVVAALSVKGGTGRTTTAIAFAIRWAARENRPVLLVDADLEAPGISYLFESYAGAPKIALEDIIALAHSEAEPAAPKTIAFAADRLKDHAMSDNLIVLPLRRDIDELASSSVRPEHLSTPDRPFALADILSNIAYALNCAGVVIDVRAGLVPLGVTLALDPEVSPIIVTTLSAQSIRATSGLLRFLSREIRRNGSSLRTPMVVINRVPVLFQQSGMDEALAAPIFTDLLATVFPSEEGDVSPTQDRFSDAKLVEPFVKVKISEISDMHVPSGDWSAFARQISDTGFSAAISGAAERWIGQELRTLNSIPEFGSLAPITMGNEDRRKELKKFAEELISAENAAGQVPKPLVTAPLASLAGRFQSEVPIAVSEGAKGTGKTLAARYFVAQNNWRTVVHELVGRSDAVEGVIVPACASVQSSERYTSEVDEARKRAADTLDGDVPMAVGASTLHIKSKLPLGLDELAWVEVWLDIIAWSAGYAVGEQGAGANFISFLRSSGKSVVAVFEGLEELYSSVNDAGVTTAMRAALISLPQRLRSETRRPLGVIVFARRDTVEAAIRQNLEQYRRDYLPFALRWTEDDVLELAAWLATKSNAISDLWNNQFSNFTQAEKTQQLEKLWGAKLGPDDTAGKRTREAYTATWIVAVLSDLRGRLVPRDLVRFLSNAASSTLANEDLSQYGNRLLIPKALKDAVEPTSEAKVRETQEEIEELKPIFAKFRKLAGTAVAPLTEETLDNLGIGKGELEVLVRHGIVYGDRAPYEVPELFRRGLGLRHAGARRSVVNLYRKARTT